MNAILDAIGRHRLVPVISLDDAKQARPLGEALLAGGLPCAEVTFRTDAAAESIKAMAQLPGLLLGAGTVLKIDQIKQAIDLGATFIVAPGFNPKIVGYCVEHGIPVMPGISTPTDIEMALEFGLEAAKFFPAEAFGGVETLKAICGPYAGLRFMPTGGITTSNLLSYLAFPRVLACGGSWMVRPEMIAAADFSGITKLVRAAVELVQSSSPKETRSVS